MSEDFGEDRRRLLTALGTAAATGLAGCSSDIIPGEESTEEPTTERTTDETTTGTETTTEVPDYDISLRDTLSYDLRSLPTADLGGHTRKQVDENYSKDLGTISWDGDDESLAELLSQGNGDEWRHIEEVTLEAERTVEKYDEENDEIIEETQTQTVETTEEGYIPEYEVHDGDTLTLTAELDNGETKTGTTQVEKQLPENYRIDVRTPENFNTGLENYTTPYQFDNHHFKHQHFHKKRENKVFEKADELDQVDWSVLENFYKDKVQNEGLSEKQKKQKMIYAARGHMINQEIEPEFSAQAEMHAIYEEAILRELNNRDVLPWEEIFFSGYDTIGDGGHGRVASYIGGDMHEDILEKGEKPDENDTWYMVGTTYAEVVPSNNFQNSQMVNGTKEDFISPIAEIWNPNEHNTLSFEERMVRAGSAVLGFPGVSGNLGRPVNPNKSYSRKALENIRENEEWESFMIPAEVAVDARIGREDDRAMILAESDSEGAMLIDSPQKEAGEVLSNPDFQNPEVIEGELLTTSD